MRRDNVVNNNDILILHLVRFAAAFLVMLFHLGFWSWWDVGEGGTIQQYFPDLPRYSGLAPFVWHGWVGVQVFFLISGLVIAISYTNKSPRKFLKARLLRLYPTAWISAALLLPIVLVFSPESSWQVMARFINSIVLSPYPRWLDGVFWTLAVEMIFYCSVFFWGGILCKKSLRGLSILLALWSGGYVVGIYFFGGGLGWLSEVLLLRHGVFFSLGIFLYMYLLSDDSRRSDFYWCVFLAGLCLVEVYCSAEAKSVMFGYGEAMLLSPVFVWLFFFLVVYFGVKKNSSISIKSELLSRCLREIGKMTFPLYLLHSVVGGLSLMSFSLFMEKGVALLFSFCVVMICSFGISKYIDPYLTGWVRNRFFFAWSGWER